ncbi:MAG: cupin domain-containing protein [Bdellovibrionota bacterium]
MNKPPFIGNYKDFMEEDNQTYKGSDELLAYGAPVGKKLGLEKIGIHVVTIPPGRRTSWPHAESAEEEFAYVIEGNPSVWNDGYLTDLKPGDFIAWPAGTGICHTILNNTKENCLVLVGGEANKDENKCYYALNPKRNEEIKKTNFLWEDWPERDFGPHDGIPKK